MQEEIWRLPRVLSTTGMGRTWLYEQIKIGRFPKPLKLGFRAVGWRRSEIENWLTRLECATPEKGGQNNEG